MSEAAPIDTMEVRLDLIRSELAIHLAALLLLVQIAATYLDLDLDARTVGAMNDVAERMRSAIAVLKRLQQTRGDAAVSAAAATEWRAQRSGRER